MAKRSCDYCVRRKTRCDNGLPCRKCMEAKPPLECTYLNPVLKRGPKTTKLRRPFDERQRSRGDVPRKGFEGRRRTLDSNEVPLTDSPLTVPARCSQTGTRCLPTSVFVSIVEIYRSRMYPVWPVLDTHNFLTKLEEPGSDGVPNVETYTLAAALCAATMAQLDLDPVKSGPDSVDSTYMERECLRARNSTNYREHPSIACVLTSFFLHVYHAKIDNRNAAFTFLQEAISLARLLHLDNIGFSSDQSNYNSLDQQRYQQRMIYLLLWVSERGYAIQHDLRTSIQDTIELPSSYCGGFDIYGEGLVELGSLFAVFDSTFRHRPRHVSEQSPPVSDKQLLVAVHNSLTINMPRPATYDPLRRADYYITKQWMKVLLWQQAMSRGLLSSASDVESMTFLFPSQIAQELLASMTRISQDDLLPLGRDQVRSVFRTLVAIPWLIRTKLMKVFEITNTLADVILCVPAASIPPREQLGHRFDQHSHYRPHSRECCRYGPADFLHGLFQTISPFLKDDRRLDVILRQKAAEALLRAPSRVLSKSIGCSSGGSGWSVEENTGERARGWEIRADGGRDGESEFNLRTSPTLQQVDCWASHEADVNAVLDLEGPLRRADDGCCHRGST